MCKFITNEIEYLASNIHLVNGSAGFKFRSICKIPAGSHLFTHFENGIFPTIQKIIVKIQRTNKRYMSKNF